MYPLGLFFSKVTTHILADLFYFILAREYQTQALLKIEIVRILQKVQNYLMYLNIT